MGHERVWEKNYCGGKVLSDLLASYAKHVLTCFAVNT